MHIAAQKFTADQPARRQRIGEIGTSAQRHRIERIVLCITVIDDYGGVGNCEASAHADIRIEEISPFHAGRATGRSAELRLLVDIVSAQRNIESEI